MNPLHRLIASAITAFALCVCTTFERRTHNWVYARRWDRAGLAFMWATLLLWASLFLAIP